MKKGSPTRKKIRNVQRAQFCLRRAVSQISSATMPIVMISVAIRVGVDRALGQVLEVERTDDQAERQGRIGQLLEARDVDWHAGTPDLLRPS